MAKVKKTMIRNGEELNPFYIVTCENCGIYIGENEPREDIKGTTYCGDCAFLLGLLDENSLL